MDQQEQPNPTASQSQSSVELIPRKYVDVIWHIVVDKIKAATDKTEDEVSLHEILSGLHDQTMQMWVTDDSEMVAITQINTYSSGKKYLTYVICSGSDFKKYGHFEETINEWGRSQGCIGSELYGRPGWQKVLKDYRTVHVLLRREYEDT